jgi:hypothetical protein
MPDVPSVRITKFDKADESPADSMQYIVTVLGKVYFRRAFYRAISLLADEWNWYAIDGSDVEEARQAGAVAYTSIEEYMPPDPQIFPVSVHWFHSDAKVIAGNQILGQQQNNQWYNVHFYQTGPAVGNKWSYSVLLGAGNYHLSMLYHKWASGGIMALKHGATTIGSVDFYNAAFQYNQISSWNITIATSGIIEFTGEITGKNASSASYRADITRFYLRPQ